MCHKIEQIKKIDAGTTAQTVKVNGYNFLIQNMSENATIYFKEMYEDGVAATDSNGYAVGPGKETLTPLTAYDLSVVASADETDVRVLILDMA